MAGQSGEDSGQVNAVSWQGLRLWYSHADVPAVLTAVVGVPCISHLQSKYPCQLVEGTTGPEVRK